MKYSVGLPSGKSVHIKDTGLSDSHSMVYVVMKIKADRFGHTEMEKLFSFTYSITIGLFPVVLSQTHLLLFHCSFAMTSKLHVKCLYKFDKNCNRAYFFY